MIRTVSVENYLGEKLDLELTAPEKSGLYIQSITGLGSGDASINITDMASNDGGVFNSARAQTRNITITLGMYEINTSESEWSIEKARRSTYKYFPKKKPLTLYFETDDRSLYINGYVESNEVEIFEEREISTISILCPDPNFYKKSTSIDQLAVVTDNLEFPYSNESLTEELTEFGLISIDVPVTVIDYAGDVEIGILFRMRCRGHVEGLSIFNAETGETMSIDDSKLDSTALPGGISDGDTIEISTVRGNKYATIIREGNHYNILNALGMNPNWFQIHPKDNVFALTTTSGTGNVEIEILYNEAYEGM